MIISKKLLERIRELDVNQDYALYICSHILNLSRKGSFVNVHKSVKDAVGSDNYKQTIKILLDNKVIERDYFVANEKAFWFRVPIELKNSRYVSFKPSSYKLNKESNKLNKQKKNKMDKAPLYLREMKMAIKYLSWDFDLMDEFIDSYVPSKSSWDKSKGQTKLTYEQHCDEVRDSMRMSVAKLREGDIHFDRDTTSNRLHTNITNMNSDLFKTNLDWLIEIDVKNSQPFFLYVALKIIYDIYKENEKVTLTDYVSEDMEGYAPSYIAAINDGADVGLLPVIEEFTPTFFTPKLTDSFGLELESFKNLVVSGNFYEHFSDMLNITREEAKLMTFEILFSKNSSFRQSKYKFSSQFPLINKVIESIKEDSHNTLAIMLQTMESHVVIDVLCKRLYDEHSITPITKHDSLAVKEDDVKKTLSVMNGVFMEYCGIIPKFSVKNLNK